MSIFGQLDAAKIPTNPFYIAAGTYNGEVTEAEFREKKDGTRYLFIEYVITDVDSGVKGKKVQSRFDVVDPSMTEEQFALLPADEKEKLRGKMINLKKTLCGQEGFERQKGLGQTPDDLNDPDWDPGVMKGLIVVFGIRNFGTDGVKVQWVNLAD